MRPVALSRENALFAGRDDGAENWAAMTSPVETCKLDGIDPKRYFAGRLMRLANGWRQSRTDELMIWSKANALVA